MKKMIAFAVVLLAAALAQGQAADIRGKDTHGAMPGQKYISARCVPGDDAGNCAVRTGEEVLTYDRDDAGTPVLVASASGDASTQEVLVNVRYRVNASGDMCILPQRWGDNWNPVTTCSLSVANVPNGSIPLNPSQPEEMSWAQNSNTLAPCPTRDAGPADGSICGGDGGTLKMAGQCVTGACKATFTRLWPH